jgi:predicted MPP superfamily phosphohydrolase
LLHVSDLHVEHITKREQALLRVVEDLTPDLLVLTGDYLNLSYNRDEESQAETRDLLEAMCRSVSCPVFAITGSPLVDIDSVIPSIFEGLPITWLMNESKIVTIKDETIELVGLRCTGDRTYDAQHLKRLLEDATCPRFRILLYHSPDLMPEATAAGVDLYLCGHTHGGQLRLPLFGALITSSVFWKRYEMGRYEEHGTTLYVSRGIGMEGLGAPRARFLAPPEIGLWHLST